MKDILPLNCIAYIIFNLHIHNIMTVKDAMSLGQKVVYASSSV